ncbi:raffinose/stachyose/melibiose transport system substrate-binding protein [Diaminobutyricimonas aerilata]|uniref:Raffinose/stachyose/melibiose transport system substrate-binding protein n=1 Tax=Diaminobutyricimonas aerilata TaxID=1162967 RepID=A0A2M9CFL5_9MICO|nr:ABC transporter substrate-binding protein [Diaminobutyricimonas aerilata]PJJ70640.1 raffinose/stachyose/melibiose transport system substrate-binding protein [Diaminobutyricimonas aerilata]
MRAGRKSVALVAGAAVVVGLAGCSAGGSADGKTQITWFKLTETAETANEAIAQIVSDFESENPDIDVVVEERAVDAHKDALRTTLGTSGAPDIFFSWAGPGLGGEFIEVGASLDLEKYYEEFGWADRFSEATLETVTQYGQYDGVPYTQRGEALFYNKDLFAKAGVDAVPTTYDELVAAAEKLKAAGITPIQFGGTVNWHVMRLLDSILETKCGSDGYQALVTHEASWADEECVTETFTEFEKWTSEYLNPGFISINNDESSALFYSGEAAMALEGDWFNQVIRDNGMDESTVGLMPFPTGTGRLYGFNENNYISSNSENPDAAAAFLDYLTSEDAQKTFIAAFGSQSVNVNVQAEGGSELDQAWTPIFENATGIYMNNDQNLSLAETTEYWRIQNLVATGELDPADAGSEFQKFLDQQ